MAGGVSSVRASGPPKPAGRRISAGSIPDERTGTLRTAALPALAGVLLAWSLTTLVGDVHWGPLNVLAVLAACLSPLIVVLALPVIVLAFRRRRWSALIPALVAAGLPWIFVVGYALPAAAPRSAATTRTAALLVTAHDGAAAPDDVLAAVSSHPCDLVVITELSARLAHDLAAARPAWLPTARYVVVPGPGQSAEAGLGIYSRYPVQQVQPLLGTRWPAARATVLLDGRVDGRALTLVAGHAVPPTQDVNAWRRDLATFGAAARIPGPVLVLANLGATPWQPQLRRIVSTRLHDAADLLGRGLRPTWPSWSGLPLLPIDHALLADAGAGDVDTVPIAGTDHRALWVEARVPA